MAADAAGWLLSEQREEAGVSLKPRLCCVADMLVSANVEDVAGHLAVAVVIIHTSQMAFPWASMKRTGQGLSCQVLPGPKTTLGQYAFHRMPLVWLNHGSDVDLNSKCAWHQILDKGRACLVVVQSNTDSTYRRLSAFRFIRLIKPTQSKT
ncbi:unnamed protein product [Pleuronectes platessa]|uniref:Uncharacterized protein n=1 Tax=Pleuronectes platessa TaxID=8262 RepID=A0A9N7V9D6_PLEPL|nr:unnamed protein product [Pleuronectes platessa]